MSLDFRDPPFPESRGRWVELSALLKDRPGEWACLGIFTLKEAGSGYQALKHRGFDATRNKLGEDKIELFARWPGEQ